MNKWWLIGPIAGCIIGLMVAFCVRILHLSLFEAAGIAVVVGVLLMSVIYRITRAAK
jgi:hypothetical protein